MFQREVQVNNFRFLEKKKLLPNDKKCYIGGLYSFGCYEI